MLAGRMLSPSAPAHGARCLYEDRNIVRVSGDRKYADAHRALLHDVAPAAGCRSRQAGHRRAGAMRKRGSQNRGIALRHGQGHSVQ